MLQPSGREWCARFPTSRRLEDLAQPFQQNVGAFIVALRGGAAAVSIAATYRPPERAYLMHWACMIGQSGHDPAAVPHMVGVDIDWTHGGDRQKARGAAQGMMRGYQIRFPAALVSRHTQRRAIDMTIHVPAGAVIAPSGAAAITFREACDGLDPRVIAIGKSYGVIKLLSDPPHWSDDGH
jgi:hypothetical protein